MIIKKLILKGYKRLFLNNIQYLEYTPEKSMQVILGRNMSGKSQTLRQLNPLPANLKQEFYEDGYKYIEIEHLGKLYILSSGYIEKNKHSFKVDDKELNDNGSKRSQLLLVKEYFNITPEVMDILLNNNKLTTMSIQDRKKWLSELSTIDYSYAINIYNKLRTKHRDILGGIKLTQDNILKYENCLIPEEKLIEINNDISNLDKYNKYLHTLIEHIDNNTYESKDLNILNNELNTLLGKTNEEILNLDKLKEQRIKLINNIEHYNKLIESISENITLLENIKEVDNIEQVLQNNKDLNEEYDKLNKLNTLNIKEEDSNIIYNDYNQIHLTLIGLLNELKVYDNIRLNMDKDKRIKLNNILDKLNNIILNINKKRTLYETELNHLLEHKKDDNLINCPKCEHKWFHGYDKNKEKELRDNIGNIQKELLYTTDKYNSYKDVNIKLTIVDDILEQFKNIFSNNINLYPIWLKLCSDNNIYKLNSIELIKRLEDINTTLYNIKDLDKVRKELDNTKLLIDSYNKVKEVSNNLNRSQLDKLIKDLDTYTKNKNNSINLLQEVNNKIVLCGNIIQKRQEILNVLKNKRIDYNNIIIENRNSYIKELSSYITEETDKLINLVNSSNMSKYKLETDKKNLEEYKKKEYVLDLMIKELSPTEGLIAKSINSFLNVFVKEMNNVINSIWSYDVEILSCDTTEGDDLDYKFKVKVNNSEIIEDISKLSSSMKEIADLAFRIVFAKYMKLQEIPLYLDEFGSTFDKEHRTSAYNVIDKILTSDYPQVFLVCHFSSLYGSMSNCDFNIIDSNNIELDGINSYNQHLILRTE